MDGITLHGTASEKKERVAIFNPGQDADAGNKYNLSPRLQRMDDCKTNAT